MKLGIRILAISESRLRRKSVLVGVITAGYTLEDFGFDFITVGGLDATEGVLRLRELLKRKDLRLILFSGRIIAGYNVVDLLKVHEATGLPVAAVPRGRPRKNVGEILRRYYGRERYEIYLRNKRFSYPITVGGRKRIAIVIGIEPKELESLLNRLLIGSTPYPLYLADRLARGLRRSLEAFTTRGGKNPCEGIL